MKKTVKMSRLSSLLEKMFRAFNEELFNNELEDVIITIQSSPRTYAHITTHKNWQSEENYKYEINIAAGSLNRPIEHVAASLIHEMIHLYDLQFLAIEDENGKKRMSLTSRMGRYHNKRFKQECEKRWLSISYDKTIGWSITEPTEKLVDFIIERGWEDILINRIENILNYPPTGGNIQKPISKTSTTNSHHRKYICPCCKNSVRATKMVNIMCMDCNIKMVEE